MAKKIVVLGATVYQVPLIKTARNLGFEVISVDNNADSPAHSYSDEFEIISTIDKEAVLELVKRIGASAVVTCGSDVAVPTIGYVNEAMGFVGIDYNQALTVTRKDLFRDFQRRNGLNSPEFHVFSEVESFLRKVPELNGKFVLKPVDRSGSRGVKVIDFRERQDMDQLRPIFEEALDFSLVGKVILEGFIEGTEVGGDGFFLSGEMVSFMLTNKYVSEPPLYVPTGHSVPSKLPESIQVEVECEIRKVLELLKVRSTPLNFDVMVGPDKKVTVLEMGFRTGGNEIPTLIKYSSGFDEIESLIHLVSGNENLIRKDQKFPKKAVGSKVIGSKVSGTLKSVTSSTSVEGFFGEALLEFSLDVEPGKMIRSFTQGDRRLGHIVLEAEDVLSLEKLMDDADSVVKIECY